MADKDPEILELPTKNEEKPKEETKNILYVDEGKPSNSKEWGEKKRVSRISKIVKKKKRESQWSIYPAIDVNNPEKNAKRKFPSNRISTTKYTFWNFLPKNLFEQYRRATNFYFLLVVIVTLVPQVSPITPLTSIAAVLFVLAVSAIKEAYEDLLRWKADRKINNREFQVVSQDGSKAKVRSKDIKVGDILYLQKGEAFPADLLLLNSSLEEGVCYIETSQLDGESNLKTRRAIPQLSKLSEQEIWTLKARVESEEPNHHLYSFVGRIEYVGELYPLDANQILLRGARLRNTPWVYALVLYTGRDTKLSLNEKDPPSKFSTLDKKMNRFVLWIFIYQLVLNIISGIVSGVFQRSASGMWYMGSNKDTSPALIAIIDFFANFVLLSYMIPMSLMVTLEISKATQGKIMEWDEKMTYATSDDGDENGMAVKTTNLNDELGLVRYVFSDKTGTLTENTMEFRSSSINGRKFLRPMEGELGEYLAAESENPHKTEPVKNYLRTLALCHTVVIDKDSDGFKYQSISPDEVALCDAARNNGFVFTNKKSDVLTITESGTEVNYTLLNTLAFTSDRARMSVIIRNNQGKIRLLCKGADSVILKRLKPEVDAELINSTKDHIHHFSQEGLRTLLVAEKDLTEEEYEAWNKEYRVASTSLENRDKLVAEVSEKIETNLDLIGCTAIEDKLQSFVPETIHYLLKAGIKLFIITGDKQETAIQIGYSSQLITPEQPLVVINVTGAPEQKSDECAAQLKEAYEKYSSSEGKKEKVGLVIDGEALRFALSDHAELFLKFIRLADSAICCRVTPLQKAEIVRLVKESEKGQVCLAIGDGANDVSMIQTAQIGVGIFGKEGTQAARSSDFALRRFSHLQRLITVHGRYSFIRNSTLVHTQLYKNANFAMVMFWFGIYCAYTAQILFDDWLTTFFNVILTSAHPYFLSIFEKDIKEEIIEENPECFKEVQSGKVLTVKTVSWWWLAAIYHSIIVMFLTVAQFQNDAWLEGGRVGGLTSLGMLASTSCVMVILHKFALESKLWNPVYIFFHFLSILAYFVAAIMIGNAPESWPSGYAVFQTVANTATFWLAVVVIVFVALIPDFTFKAFMTINFPANWQILQERYKWKLQPNQNKVSLVEEKDS